MRTLDRTAAVDAFRRALGLAGSDAVADAWEQESACAGMTVGGLTHHLLDQTAHTLNGLDTEPTTDPIPLLEHYVRAAWVTADLDDDVNVEIRTRGDDAAQEGREIILGAARERIEQLPDLLTADRNPDTINMSWQGWSLTTDDFLVTRLMETVVHADDLAASVGLSTPEFPEPVITPVLALLTGVAVRRHGQTALIRSLSRPQRSEGPISAF